MYLLQQMQVKLEHLQSVSEVTLCLVAHTSNVARESAECGLCIAAWECALKFAIQHLTCPPSVMGHCQYVAPLACTYCLQAILPIGKIAIHMSGTCMSYDYLSTSDALRRLRSAWLYTIREAVPTVCFELQATSILTI